MMPGDSILELGVCLGHYHLTTTFVGSPWTGRCCGRSGQRRSRMSTSVAGDFETPRPSRRGWAEKAAILAAKLLVTGACFWYVSRQIDWRQVWSAIPLLDFRWAALAIFVVMLEIPLVGLRWCNIVDALGVRDRQMTRTAMTAATSVGLFFAQVLPNVAGEGRRGWLGPGIGGRWGTAG